MSTSTETPRVCWQCLAAYNGGRLHFKWFDASSDPDELWEQIREVLRTSPELGAEEWMLADYEGFGPWRPGEWPTIERLARVVEGIEEHGFAFAAWVANDESVLAAHDDYAALEEAFREAYRGTWDSEEEYARDFVGDCGLPDVGYIGVETGRAYGAPLKPWGEILDQLDPYLDWDAITRSIMEGGWSSIGHDGQVHVFIDV